jgi:hypothetical protein
VAKLYDEHGGIDIIMNLTRVGYTTIKNWHRDYQRDPESFARAKFKPDHVSRVDFVRRVLDNSTIEKRRGHSGTAAPKFVKTKEYKAARTPNELKSMLPPDVVEKCESLQRQIIENKKKGMTLSNEMRAEIVRLVIAAGNPRPISLMLGLSEKVILGWKDIFAQELP